MLNSLRKLRGKYAIVGVGYTPQGCVQDRTALSFYLEATVNAIRDAGLTKEDIDGLICYRHFKPLRGEADITPYLVAQHLGIQPSYLGQEANCARNQLITAISLLEAGFCKYVLIVYGDNALSGGRTFIDEVTHSEYLGYDEAYGMFGPMAGYALAARRGMIEFGTGPDTWRDIAINQRRWAHLNPQAMLHGTPLTREKYSLAPYVVEPFRKVDACLITDGGRACVVTSTERAKDLPHSPVPILGIAEANPSVDINQSTFMAGQTGARQAGPAALEMAGVGLDDIDACEIYDCFTYTVELTMQDYGFYGQGEARGFFAEGRTAPGGKLPVNTSGGLLAEAYNMGLTPLTEGVMQLMGRCGSRQLGIVPGTKKPEIILCSDNGGVFQTHCSVILGRL
jgi:acetyl-CoA acetyltransferase